MSNFSSSTASDRCGVRCDRGRKSKAVFGRNRTKGCNPKSELIRKHSNTCEGEKAEEGHTKRSDGRREFKLGTEYSRSIYGLELPVMRRGGGWDRVKGRVA